jgi:hypothetical protein
MASAAMAEWFRLTDPRKLNMNANEMTAIRELTAQELNEVTGGSMWLLPFAVACLGVGLLIGDALGARTITMVSCSKGTVTKILTHLSSGRFPTEVACLNQTLSDQDHSARKDHASKVSAMVADWFRSRNMETEMRNAENVLEMNEIRELNIEELDTVSGGGMDFYGMNCSVNQNKAIGAIVGIFGGTFLEGAAIAAGRALCS